MECVTGDTCQLSAQRLDFLSSLVGGESRNCHPYAMKVVKSYQTKHKHIITKNENNKVTQPELEIKTCKRC